MCQPNSYSSSQSHFLFISLSDEVKSHNNKNKFSCLVVAKEQSSNHSTVFFMSCSNKKWQLKSDDNEFFGHIFEMNGT